MTHERQKIPAMPHGEDASVITFSSPFGGARMNRGRGRAAFNHVNRYLKKHVEAIAAVKRGHRAGGGHSE
jgi:hypothetical protein